MTRFYERGNVDEARGECRIVVRTPDGKRVEMNLPRRVFEEIEELQRQRGGISFLAIFGDVVSLP